MTKYLRRPAAALAAAFLYFTVAARATIDATVQMQLGDPSGATADPTNHTHFLIQRSQYALDYNDNNREPNWVSWDLTSGDVGGSGRSNDFEPDPGLPAGFLAVTTADYNGVGAINFNRGHMCPSEDRTDTLADNLAVFYMTNIVPQSADNNQGPWELFEDYCRQQASAGNEVLITSGPGGFNGSVLPSAAQIQVPAYTWKIAVIVPLGSGSAIDRLNAAGADAIRVIAIQIPNSSGIKSDPWENYKTTVAQIVAETGLNFFNSPALLPAVAAGLLNKPVDGQVATGLPTISVQPIPQSAPVGGSAAFSVTASDNGNPPLAYQWSKDETPISGANGATLTLMGILAGDAGSYSVTVSNALGSIVSASAPLVVTGLPATIAGQPAPASASAGSAVVFSVTAGGSAPFTYQWRKNGAPLADGGNVSGSALASLTLSDVQAGDAGSYDVVVNNSVGIPATSSPAALAVTSAGPSISRQPFAATVAPGGTATFSVAAAGTEPLAYQWNKNGVPLADGGNVSGSASATLTLSHVSATDAASYQVMVSNGAGAPVTSTAAALTINANSTIDWNFTDASGAPASGLPPGITGGIVTQNNNNGTTATITATSVSSGYAGASGGNNAGAAARTGALNTGAAGSAFFSFTLIPASGQQVSISSISFGSRSTSTGPQAYTLYSSADNFATPLATGSFPNNSAWVLYTPSFPAVTGAPNAALTFRLYGSAGTGSAATGTANWRIDDLMAVAGTSTPIPAVVSTSPAAGATGVAANLPITVAFNLPVSVASGWFSITSALNGPIAASVNTANQTTFALTPPGNFADNDTITVTLFAADITDQATGTLRPAANTSFSFTVAASTPAPVPPTVTSQPASQSVPAGASATFTVAASGTAPLSYQWRRNGVPLTGNASAATASLTLASVATTDAGNYDCVVSNTAGSGLSQPAALTVTIAPASIATPPLAQIAPAGGSATFSVTAAGSGPFTYQWMLNGVALTDGPLVSGSAAPTLTLSGLAAGQGGTLDVVVTNAAGSVTSPEALLAVSAGAPSMVYWDFATASPTSGTVPGVSGGALTQGNNNGTTQLVTAVSVSSGYPGASGGNNAGAAARIGALNPAANGSAYFEFTFTPPAGQQLAATAVSFGMRSTSTGPQAFTIFSSADNFTAAIAQGAVPNDAAWHAYAPAFAGAAGAAGAPVTFRIFGSNGAGNPSASTANWRIDDLTVMMGLLALPPVAPVVTSTSPANGATGVDLASPISITFSEAVNAIGTWVDVSSANSGPAAVQITGGPTTYTLTPQASFGFADQITVTVHAAQVTDQGTGTLSLGSDFQFSFATALPPPPVIVTSPTALTATAGNDATFTVVATGTGPLSYHWRKDGADIPGNPSAATASLTLHGVHMTDTGSYDCVVSNAGGSATSAAAGLTVNQAVATVTLGGLFATYDGSPKAASVTTNPANLNVQVTYNGSGSAPIIAGSYTVSATVTDPDFTGAALGVLVIAKAPALVTLGGLAQVYDGTPKSATVTTSPAGLAVTLTYDGSPNPPTTPGDHAVSAIVNNPNYTGSATDTLVISITSLVRHAPSLNGGLDGSLQVLSPESLTLNGSAFVSGDLLVPGTPALKLNGKPTFGGTHDGTGSASPSNYTVTLNGNAVLRNLIRRTDPISLPTVAAPPLPAGTRDVSINAAGQSPGNFSTIRNLTLNGNAGAVTVPPGTYGQLTANGNSGFVLGIAGATAPAVYDFQSLNMNGNSSFTVVGPVLITMANGGSLNGSMGSSGHPEWLNLDIASGGLTLNGNVTFNGTVVAPNGTIVINGNSTLNGEIISDQLTINGGGLLNEAGH